MAGSSDNRQQKYSRVFFWARSFWYWGGRHAPLPCPKYGPVYRRWRLGGTGNTVGGRVGPRSRSAMSEVAFRPLPRAKNKRNQKSRKQAGIFFTRSQILTQFIFQKEKIGDYAVRKGLSGVHVTTRKAADRHSSVRPTAYQTRRHLCWHGTGYAAEVSGVASR